MRKKLSNRQIRATLIESETFILLYYYVFIFFRMFKLYLFKQAILCVCYIHPRNVENNISLFNICFLENVSYGHIAYL